MKYRFEIERQSNDPNKDQKPHRLAFWEDKWFIEFGEIADILSLLQEEQDDKEWQTGIIIYKDKIVIYDTYRE